MAYWHCSERGGVVVATYHNPPMNYFCAEAAAELGALIETWQDPKFKAIVLTGGIEGRFITHYSVEELLSYAENRVEMERAGTALNDGYHALLSSLQALPKPVIAAMNGDAMGGGFELCLACDLRVGASGDFRYGLPEVKLGIIPGGSGTQRLARLLGAGRAIEFILRGRIVPPQEALELGLIHALSGDALSQAIQIADEMARLPPVALAMAKRAIYDGADLDLAGGLREEGARFLDTMLTDDSLTAMRDYLAQPLEQRRHWLEQPSSQEYSGR